MTDSTPTTISAAEAPETPDSVQAVAANWPDLLMALMHQQDLHDEQAAWAMDQIMSGRTPDVTMAAFLVAHHTKGETVEEIAGLVSAMMEIGRASCRETGELLRVALQRARTTHNVPSNRQDTN